MKETAFDVDLGGGHGLQWWTDGGNPSAGRIGAHWFHPPGPKVRPGSIAAEDGQCVGGFQFKPSVHDVPGRALWALDEATMTLSPSLLCGCGAHIFIRNGKAVVT